ncbi:MAG: peptidylprolyl isomerase [Acidobacteriota bacterium]|nr:peptidylprolyl isomerase [Acidobacteriota bacterium]
MANGLCVTTTLVLGIALVACTSSVPSQSNSNSAATLPLVVATVDDLPISSRLYEMYLKNGSEGLGLDANTDEGRRKLDQLREGIVSELIDRTLIAQEAERRGLSIPPEKMAEAERRSIADLGGEQQYDAYLAEHRLTRDEYREVVKTQVYGEMMRNELNKGLSVTDEEVQTYYKAHQADAVFQQPERVTAAHILIAARPNIITEQLQREKNLNGVALASAVREELEQRRQRAEDLRRKVATGANFAALARESSDDLGTRARGGDLGTFARNSHARAFDDTAFALKPGAVSSVVRTDFGFHVVKVSAREPARVQRLAEAAPEIRRRLLAEREAKNLTDWLREARRKAAVRISEPYRFGALKNEFP